jgi:hypothetical protein
MGHGAWGMGHGALGISRSFSFPGFSFLVPRFLVSRSPVLIPRYNLGMPFCRLCRLRTVLLTKEAGAS